MLPIVQELVLYAASGGVFLWLLAHALGIRSGESTRIGSIVLLLLAAPLSGRLLEVSGQLFEGYEDWNQTIGIYHTPTDAEWARWGGCSRRENAALRATSAGAEPRIGRCPDKGYVRDLKRHLRVRFGQAEPRSTRGAALHAALADYDFRASSLGVAYAAAMAGALALLIGGWTRQVRFYGEAGVALAVAWVLGAGHEQYRIDERALQEVAAELEPSTQALSPRPGKPLVSTAETDKEPSTKAKAKATKGKATKGKAKTP